ncbi:MAG: Na(+)-translocating NADH-quinone reductase subunit A [Myxococcota bacterium]
MARHTIKKGLDLPITGEPEQAIHDGPQVDTVAIIAADFVGMKPKMEIRVGDAVKRGQVLFSDRKTPGVVHTAPGAGKVIAVNRGARRVLLSVVIELSEGERSGTPEQVTFSSYTGKPPSDLSSDDVEGLLVESGMWTALRTRPYSKVPEPGSRPSSLFVTAIDTRPLAPPVNLILKAREGDFQHGLEVLTQLVDKIFLCKSPDTQVSASNSKISTEEFSGQHPAGLPGTHIHLLDPVSRKKTVWHISYQDVMAIGHLFATGELDVRRVISLAGPQVKTPRLLKTRMGAPTMTLTAGELHEGVNRIISGDVLSGRIAQDDVHGYLGRYDLQISVLKEDREREFIGWLMPGADKFSTVWTYLGGLLPGKKFNFTTSTHGEKREMVPIGMYERVMPLDIMPTFLLRALLTRDLERAEHLGALELDPEDLGLCTFVCPGKQDYGVELRETLDIILKEG